jgi:hypothetical protein
LLRLPSSVPTLIAPPTALEALQRLPLAAAIRESVWAFPLLEIMHISAFAAMIGTVLTVEMRVFGARKKLPLEELGKLGATIALVAFAFIITSGSLMLLSDVSGYLSNRAFVIKLGLISLAATNMVVFHLRGSLARPDGIARAQGVLSLLLWLGVISAGRMIAYV